MQHQMHQSRNPYQERSRPTMNLSGAILNFPDVCTSIQVVLPCICASIFPSRQSLLLQCGILFVHHWWHLGFLMKRGTVGWETLGNGISKWVFPKIVIPQNGWFVEKTLFKWMICGVPLFLETPKFSRKQFSVCGSSIHLCVCVLKDFQNRVRDTWSSVGLEITRAPNLSTPFSPRSLFF